MRASASSLSREKRGHSAEVAQQAPQAWQSADAWLVSMECPKSKRPPLAERPDHPAVRPSEVLSRGRDIVDRALAAAAVLGGVDRHFLALDQRADAGALERSRMDEHVLAAVIRLDEAIALLAVVELHGTVLHLGSPFVSYVGAWPEVASDPRPV